MKKNNGGFSSSSQLTDRATVISRRSQKYLKKLQSNASAASLSTNISGVAAVFHKQKQAKIKLRNNLSTGKLFAQNRSRSFVLQNLGFNVQNGKHYQAQTSEQKQTKEQQVKPFDTSSSGSAFGSGSDQDYDCNYKNPEVIKQQSFIYVQDGSKQIQKSQEETDRSISVQKNSVSNEKPALVVYASVESSKIQTENAPYQTKKAKHYSQRQLSFNHMSIDSKCSRSGAPLTSRADKSYVQNDKYFATSQQRGVRQPISKLSSYASNNNLLANSQKQNLKKVKLINSNSFAGSLETKVSFDGTIESHQDKFQSSKLNEVINDRLKLQTNFDINQRSISPISMNTISPMTYRDTFKPALSFVEHQTNNANSNNIIDVSQADDRFSNDSQVTAMRTNALKKTKNSFQMMRTRANQFKMNQMQPHPDQSFGQEPDDLQEHDSMIIDYNQFACRCLCEPQLVPLKREVRISKIALVKEGREERMNHPVGHRKPQSNDFQREESTTQCNIF
ncbi:UNKNOWN [Stylonychia lemnae]|uniref:Uncharacterized protein n=1 Tax=Stylonychia lemnae TaxID=5949 RepID=A0A077ZUR4_STYLE|nr:UNKNOWN [Stylonychia lemnae]|eukprot:CDW72191.1 UNKNOWN [Stylonychia lemnae]